MLPGYEENLKGMPPAGRYRQKSSAGGIFL